jgi:hypothetical protein
MEKADMRRTLACFVAVLTIAPAMASDNSSSSLEVIALLENAGSVPISATPPPPINIRPRPPTLQVLQAQLAADQELIYNEELALYQAQLQLNFWLAQPPDPSGLEDPNVPQWQQAVESAQNTLNTVQAQVNRLTAQIAAAR